MDRPSDLFAKINQSFNQLSKGQKLLANFIVESYDKAAFMTAAKMGQVVGVSESTVVRFAYAMGFGGYPELQSSLQELIRNRLTSVQRIQLTLDMNPNDVLKTVLKSDMSNIRTTTEHIDFSVFNTAVDMLDQARAVYIIGLGSSMPLAQFFGYYLGFMLDNACLVSLAMSGLVEQMTHIKKDDVCLGISFPRYSKLTLDAMRFARKKGARLIALTDSTASPIAEISECSLVARSDMVSFADSLVAPLSLINALIVALSIKRRDELEEHLKQIEAIWNVSGVYASINSDPGPNNT